MSATVRNQVHLSPFLDSGRHGETVRLILDVRMPGMDGSELQRCLNEARRQIPTIFINAHSFESDERRARKAGAVDSLRNPMNDEKFLAVIQTTLKGKENDERTRQ